MSHFTVFLGLLVLSFAPSADSDAFGAGRNPEVEPGHTALLGPELLELGQAATVRIVTFGDVDLEHPFSATIRKAAVVGEDAAGGRWGTTPGQIPVLQLEWDRDAKAGAIARGRDYGEHSWQKIAADPSRYLDFTARTASRAENVVLRSGAGAIVAADGVVLTSEELFDPGGTPCDESLRPRLLRGVVLRIVGDLGHELGGEPPSRLRAQLERGLMDWVASATTARSEFRRVRVQLAQGGPETGLAARVLALGEAGDGIAVLKIDAAVPLRALQLGDSRQVRAGEAVHCFAPSRHGAGQFGEREPPGEVRVLTLGGDPPCELTAADSGGPVLDPRGALIALGLAAPLRARGQCRAVPIERAHDRLARAGLVPAPPRTGAVADVRH